MSLVRIGLFVVVLVLVIVAIRYMVRDANTLSGLTSGKTMQKIDANDLDSSDSSAGSSNFTYSIWVFVDDWNYRYGEQKILFGRMIDGTTNNRIPCPSVSLGAAENNLIVSMAVYDVVYGNDNNNNNNNSNAPYKKFSCGIVNVPIQRWVNVLISVNNRTLDIYMNGKLVKTCVLPGVAKIDATAPVFVTPLGGFSGWTSKFQYWNDACDPQKAWNIYSTGYGGSWLGNLFNTYSVKISLMEGDVEDTSFTL